LFRDKDIVPVPQDLLDFDTNRRIDFDAVGAQTRSKTGSSPPPVKGNAGTPTGSPSSHTGEKRKRMESSDHTEPHKKANDDDDDDLDEFRTDDDKEPEDEEETQKIPPFD